MDTARGFCSRRNSIKAHCQLEGSYLVSQRVRVDAIQTSYLLQALSVIEHL